MRTTVMANGFKFDEGDSDNINEYVLRIGKDMPYYICSIEVDGLYRFNGLDKKKFYIFDSSQKIFIDPMCDII